MRIFKRKRVYLDYNASTPPVPEVFEAFKSHFHYWGNPSSVHQGAAAAKNLLWKSRQKIAKFIGCHSLEILFTSGASESNNFALKGFFDKYQGERNELIISSVEHPSIMMVAEYLAQKGIQIHKVPVSREGKLDEEFFDAHLNSKTLLVSIMAANNETGCLFPLPRLIKKAHAQGAIFHSDMVQVLGKIDFKIQDLNLDLASFSAHKCYGLKGCGILYCKKDLSLENLIHGGPQERSRRAGTENLTGINSFGVIAEKGEEFIKENEKIEKIRDQMEEDISQFIPQVEIIGKQSRRLPNTSSLFIPDIEGETLLMNLDLKGFSVSVGSACNSGKINSSSTLTSMGFTEKEAKNCIRVSLGYGIRKKDIDRFVKTLRNVIKRLKSLKD